MYSLPQSQIPLGDLQTIQSIRLQGIIEPLLVPYSSPQQPNTLCHSGDLKQACYYIANG